MNRKILLSVIIVFCSLISINAQTKERKLSVKRDSVVKDSTEYELVVFDTGFETWFLMRPGNEHSLGYYRSRNRLYVMEWNYRFMNPIRYRDIYECQIQYDPDIDYGLEFERRLYYYFKYFEETNKVSLDQGRR